MGDRQALRQLVLKLDDVIAEERRGTAFVNFAGGDHHDQLNDVRLLGFDAQPIEMKKQIGRRKSGALVAIDEWVVLGDAEKISGRQLAKVGLAVDFSLLWPV